MKFQSNKFIGTGVTAGAEADKGLTIRESKLIQVANAKFDNNLVGISVGTSTDVKLRSNRFVGMTSDGINIVNSHRVTATANS